MTEILSGQDLIDAGCKQGKWFGEALRVANILLENGKSRADALDVALAFQPAPPVALRAPGETVLHENIRAETALEEENVAAVRRHMVELLRTPVVKSGAIMPDACPAGPLGTIPVGGIAVSEAIHPGMHSADICCSMALSVFPGIAPSALLDAVHAVTHFGPGGRARGAQLRPGEAVLDQMRANPFLSDKTSIAIEHFATQGDGNHFAYVGQLASTGATVLVTHHGSRGPGASLYDAGMRVADQIRKDLSPETLRQNAWIPADTREGDDYWQALQIIRTWTRENHFAIHDMAADRLTAKVADRFWNEHNFVFRKSDGLFYHGKGATPAFDGWADDATDLTLIPLNMAEPILIARGLDAANGLGFSPHGAGRNFSRTQHKRLQAGRSEQEIFAEETRGLDVRFFSGNVDISELPSAYKNASQVRQQIGEFGLAEIVDEVIPFGCIMAGNWNWAEHRKPKRRG